MRQVGSPGSDSPTNDPGTARSRLVIVVGIVAIVSVIGVGAVLSMPAAVVQPIPFNHYQHVEDVGLECVDCHLYAVSGSRATIPTAAICADCHDEALGDSETEAWLLEQIEAEQPIEWRKLYYVPQDVFFSHQRHTAVAEIECAECHGNMGELTEPPTRPLVSISMTRCTACHYETGASNDCIACHW